MQNFALVNELQNIREWNKKYQIYITEENMSH